MLDAHCMLQSTQCATVQLEMAGAVGMWELAHQRYNRGIRLSRAQRAQWVLRRHCAQQPEDFHCAGASAAAIEQAERGSKLWRIGAGEQRPQAVEGDAVARQALQPLCEQARWGVGHLACAVQHLPAQVHDMSGAAAQGQQTCAYTVNARCKTTMHTAVRARCTYAEVKRKRWVGGRSPARSCAHAAGS